MREEKEAFKPWRVGMHVSIAGSFGQAAEKAHQLGCSALQIFSCSPRMWKSRQLGSDEIAAFAGLRQQYNLHPLVIHANYLLNLASPVDTQRNRSLEAFCGEIGRAAALGADYLVLHPGSYREGSLESGIKGLAAGIRDAARTTAFGKVTLLIENTCGQGNTLGGSFEQLRDILALLDGVPAAVCIDTAHCFAAGMDISSRFGLGKIIDSLRRTVGLDRVKVLHVNDCRSKLGSHLDRHEHIGKGGIGLAGLKRVVNDPSLRDKTFILETPIDQPGDDHRNMEAIRSLRTGTRLPRSSHGPKLSGALLSPRSRSGREAGQKAKIPGDGLRMRQHGKGNR